MYNTDMPSRAELPGAGKLLRSTMIAALVAAALLVTTVLPAEYGIDPTGVGHALGLKHMGEIKSTLATEAKGEDAQPTAANYHGHDHGHEHGHDRAPVTAAVPAATPDTPGKFEPVAGRQDTMTVTLKPGQGAEVKLTMNKDSRVRYEWTSAGGPVNFDTHGDPHNAPKNFYHGYGKGRNQPGDKGELIAAFDGKHGWFWRNRSGSDVTVTLKTEGDYAKIERVL